MSATKILWGQILAVFALALAGVWAATQWTAATLGYFSRFQSKSTARSMMPLLYFDPSVASPNGSN